jgi:hypothetical protein
MIDSTAGCAAREDPAPILLAPSGESSARPIRMEEQVAPMAPAIINSSDSIMSARSTPAMIISLG